MSDDVKHLADDLFSDDDAEKGTNEDDVSTDAEGTDKDDRSDLLGDLPSERDRAKKNFIDGWVRKIKSGEKSLDDMRNSDQSWLLPDVEALVSKSSGVNRDELVQLARQEARKILNEERSKEKLKQEEAAFKNLKKQIENLALTKEQKVKISTRYSSLVDRVGKYDALSLAAEAAGVDFEEDIGERKRQMQSPKTGWAKSNDDEINIEEIDPNSLTFEQRYKMVAARKARQ